MCTVHVINWMSVCVQEKDECVHVFYCLVCTTNLAIQFHTHSPTHKLYYDDIHGVRVVDHYDALDCLITIMTL